MDHQNSLQFPSDVSMSQDAKKLISAFLESGSVLIVAGVVVLCDCVMLCVRDKRMGKNGAEEIKRHSFFKQSQWTWKDIRSCELIVLK